MSDSPLTRLPAKADEQLALSAGLTAKTNQLCIGLEYGVAEIIELVTPTTAELLKWWFGEDMIAARSTLNFHAGQPRSRHARLPPREGQKRQVH